MRSVGGYVTILETIVVCQCLGVGGLHRVYAPVCSVPLNTYNLQPSIGFLASGGSLYLRTVLFFPSTLFTVFVSAANNPEGLKLGLPLASSTGDLDLDLDRLEERGDADLPPLRTSLSLALS